MLGTESGKKEFDCKPDRVGDVIGGYLRKNFFLITLVLRERVGKMIKR